MSSYIDNLKNELLDKEEEINRLKKELEKYQLKGGETECPLCGCDFHDNEIFVCEVCKEIYHIDDKCNDHNEKDVCKNCCEECTKYDDFYNDIDSKIDRIKLGE